MCCYTPSPVLRPAHAGFMYVLYCLSFTLQHPVGAPTQSFFLILFQTLAQCWPDGAACTNRARSKTSTYGAEHLYLHTSPRPEETVLPGAHGTSAQTWPVRRQGAKTSPLGMSAHTTLPHSLWLGCGAGKASLLRGSRFTGDREGQELEPCHLLSTHVLQYDLDRAGLWIYHYHHQW